MIAYSPDLFWLVIISFVVAFALSFGIGANDVANSFGTAVGARTLSLRSACILATIFEISGAILIGHKVSDTLRKVLIDVYSYQGSEKELALGYLSSLGGSATWLMIATSFSLPISGTHSIVGATIGFSLVAKGFGGLKWSTLFGIVASWFVSPICSGTVSVLVYLLVRQCVLCSANPVRNGLKSLPLFYGLTVAVNVFSVIEGGSKFLRLDRVSLSEAFVVSALVGFLSATAVHLFVVPKQRIKLNCATPPSQPAVKMNVAADTGVFCKSRAEFDEAHSTAEIRPTSTKVETSRPNNDGDDDLLLLRLRTVKNDGDDDDDDDDDEDDNNQHDDTAAVKVNGGVYGYGGDYDCKSDRQKLRNTTEVAAIEMEKLRASYHHLEHDEKFENSESVFSAVATSSDGCTNGKITRKGLKPNASAVPLIEIDSPTSSNAIVTAPTSGSAANDKLRIGNTRPVAHTPVETVFTFLQILTAIFGSFAHGGNDVSNAIGPLIAIWLIYADGSVSQSSETPFFILLYGGIGISVGLCVWGRNVIKTVGEDLTLITPSTGFSIEIGSSVTVLLASKLGVPISTTHCKVGSVVFVGWSSSSVRGVDWSLFKNIILAWVVTLPASAVLSAVLMYALLHYRLL